MKQYLDMCRKALNGQWKNNRTGIPTIGYIGDFCKYDMADGFPVVTTKKFWFRSCIAEFLGFLRGYDNAADFRKLGTKVWDANANRNETWLANPNRKGEDDMGRVYGVQARDWAMEISDEVGPIFFDQLKSVIDDLSKGIDNRREIITHWNPGEMDRMSLPPCHLLYQFGIQGDRLCLSMYQRSCDLPLGVPFDIVGYAWLLHVVARITGLKPGVFNHYLHDIHIYENQVDQMQNIQLLREPRPLPRLEMNPDIRTLEDLETWVTVKDFNLKVYNPYGEIKYPFAV